MRLIIIWLSVLLGGGVTAKGMNGSDTTRRLPLPAPKITLPPTVVLTDSIPGAFIQKLDDLYEKWYVMKYEQEADSLTSLERGGATSLPDSVYLNRLDRMNSAIKLSYNQIVKDFIELYTIKRRAQVATMLGLSEYYFPIFEEALDREGLPHELKYLPVIESALNPRAFSRAGACGLWQFMPSTGRLYKLQVNSFVDERRDPIRSTEAAVAFLKDLYRIYNDWILVIAAYNCGPGNVNKAIRRSGEKRNYWDIYYRLPKETRGYVPAFIAAMYVFNYHKEHGIYPAANELPTMCDTILINEGLHFEQITKLMDISTEQLRDLNPQYRRDVVPAGFGKTYALKMPYNYVGEFIDKQDTIFAHNRSYYFDDSDRLANPQERIKHYAHVAPSNKAKLVYTVKNGDVIGKIAMKFNVRVADLRYWNGLNRNLIRVGQKLVVYVPKNKVQAYQKNTKYAGMAANAEVETEPLRDGDYEFYTIRSGDNLWDIAKKYPGISAQDIMRWNALTPKTVKKLKPGQKLKIKI